MEVRVFIHGDWNKYTKEIQYSCHSCDMADYGYIFITEQTVQFESPTEAEFKKLVVKILEAKLQKKQAEAYREQEAIRQEIQEMLAIEHKEIDDDIPF